MKIRSIIVASLIPLPLAFLDSQAGADPGDYRAIVVGVNRYPTTRAPRLLGACGDAQAFAESCRSRGMKVSLLEDAAASKQQILQLLHGCREEKVVFYFSGYGSGPAEPTLLCADTNESGGRLQGALALEELDHALLQLPAQEKIVILDACFTAARGSKDGPSEQTVRYYRPHQEAASRDVMLASAQQLPRVSHNKIRYICACRYNEEALEGSYEGHQAGFFSATLCKTLHNFPNLTWQGVQIQVASQVSLLGSDRQHPVFPSECLQAAVFNGAGTGTIVNHSQTKLGGDFSLGVGGPVTTAWDAFGVDVPDAKAVQVSVSPDKDTVVIGQSVELKINIGKPGFLVVVNLGSEGGFNLLYPRSGQPLRVVSGQTVQIPEQGATLTPDRAGRERVKAFLFASPDKAEEFLKAAQPAAGSRLEQAAVELGSRALVFGNETEPGRAPVLTSDLTFEVVSRVR
ncbi:caspase family protein [bacterium]|nr:caspase family protein [bacterium]